MRLLCTEVVRIGMQHASSWVWRVFTQLLSSTLFLLVLSDSPDLRDVANAQALDNSCNATIRGHSTLETKLRRKLVVLRAESRRRNRNVVRYVCTTGILGPNYAGLYCWARACGLARNGRPVNGYFYGRGCLGELVICYGNVLHMVCR